MKVASNPNAKGLETFSYNLVLVDTLFQAAFQTPACLSQRGRLGLIPGATLQGDLVLIFLGADIPFVLRTTDAGVQVPAGQCYNHDIMNG